MRSKLTRWGLSVVTMASVATAVLFATGWQSALAAQVSSVFLTNTSSNPVPVSGTVTVSGTPSVNVGNLPTDTNGNLKVAEQGTPTVHVNNTDANGNLKVAEQGTPNVDVQNFPSSQTVNGSVSVDNFPDAPTTSVLGADVTALNLVPLQLIGIADLSAYREVTLYIRTAEPNNDAAGHCDVATGAADNGNLRSPDTWTIDSFSFDSTTTIKTYDPAPPSIRVLCTLEGVPGGPAVISPDAHWLLTGRTG